MTDQGRGLLLRLGLGPKLDAILGGQVVKDVAGSARLDQIGHEERVVNDVQPQGLGVVRDEGGFAELRVEAPTTTHRRRPRRPGRERRGRPRPRSRPLPQARRSGPPATEPARPRRRMGAAGSASSITSTRCSRFLNSYWRNISFSRERSGGESTSCDGSQSRGRSRRIVASTFESSACWACSCERLRRAARARPQCSSTFSTRAVLRDQLACGLVADAGTPGMLSEVSPFEPDEVGDLVGG